jgi:hypothetical protein
MDRHPPKRYGWLGCYSKPLPQAPKEGETVSWAEEFVIQQHIPQFAAEGCARYFTGGRHHQRLQVALYHMLASV